MKKNLHKIIIFIVFSCFVFSTLGVYAATKTASQKKKEIEAKMSKATTEYNSAKEKKLYYDDQAADLQADIDELDEILDSLDIDIANRNTEIEDANGKLAIKKDSFAKRLRALQQRGAMSYMDVIFGADNFSDFLVRLTLVGNIINHDKTMINEIASIKNALTLAKTDLQNKRDEQQEAKDLVDRQKTNLVEMANKQKDLMSEITSDQEQYKKEYAAAVKQMQEEEERSKTAVAAPSKVVYKGNGQMQWPVPAGGRISCRFGYRTDPIPSNHTGIDIAIATGNAIVAANAGTVTQVVHGSYGYGKYVIINHGDGSATLYAHASQIYVTVGQKVARGERIAAVGSTGFSTGPHLHFEVIINGKKVNPEPYIT